MKRIFHVAAVLVLSFTAFSCAQTAPDATDKPAPGAGKLSATDETQSQAYITVSDALKNGNFCSAAGDCASIGNQCPFGCNIAVNKQNKTTINNMLTTYGTRVSPCENTCEEAAAIECQNAKCVAVAAAPAP